MKKLTILIVAALLTPTAAARVWTRVYRCDGTTPLAAVDANFPDVYRDIMVGTRLVVVISSDAGGPWWGGFTVPDDELSYGALLGRGFSEESLSYEDTCLPGAGREAAANTLSDAYYGTGLQFSINKVALPGDWFILDYEARSVGRCTPTLFDTVLGPQAPLARLAFRHVPSRDFEGDGVVNFRDFARLASLWGSFLPPDPNGAAQALDLDASGRVGAADLALFSEYWLERADCRPSAAEPNQPLSAP
jgi:hypothetical protein